MPELDDFEPIRIPFDAFCLEHLQHHSESEIANLDVYLEQDEHTIHCIKCGFESVQPRQEIILSDDVRYGEDDLVKFTCSKCGQTRLKKYGNKSPICRDCQRHQHDIINPNRRKILPPNLCFTHVRGINYCHTCKGKIPPNSNHVAERGSFKVRNKKRWHYMCWHNEG
jgi:Zn finger protein HypA/HybF involved in hydrogenase expression